MFLLLFFVQVFEWQDRSPFGFQPPLSTFHKNQYTRRRLRHMYFTQYHGPDANMMNFEEDVDVVDTVRKLSRVFIDGEICSLMFVTNLVNPQWAPVRCGTPILADVLCSITKLNRSNRTEDQNHQQGLLEMCSAHQILKSDKCFHIFWKTPGAQNITRLNHTVVKMTRKDIKQFDFLFKSTGYSLSPLFRLVENSRAKLGVYNQLLDRYIFTSTSDSGGFLLNRHDPHTVDLGGHILLCEEGHFTSVVSQCGEDLSCLMQPNRFKLSGCSSSKLGETADCSVNKLTSKPFKQTTFPNSSDVTVALAQFDKRHTCADAIDISCFQADNKCFPVYKVCVYSTDASHCLVSCKSGAHLQNCKEFECNKMFKCPNYYCIPWSYVCDGKFDCPNGKDEQQECLKGASRCQNMFKCTGGSVCLHIGSVCDGKLDCPAHDDEILCQLKGIACPSNCLCNALAIQCNRATSINFLRLYPHTCVVVVNSWEKHFQTVVNSFPSAQYLTVNHGEIHQICFGINLTNLIHFNMSFNMIQDLSDGCFEGLPVAKYVDFSHNDITKVSKFAFKHLTSLTSANLSFNNMLTFPEMVIRCSELLFESLYSVNIPKRTFRHVNVKIFVTQDFRFCCLLDDQVECKALFPWYMSCSKLIYSKIASIWLILAVVVVSALNGMCLVMTVSSDKNIFRSSYGVHVISLCAKSCLFVMFSLVLWFANVGFGSGYILVYQTWLSSPLCYGVFALSTYFHLLSPALLFFFSFCRVMIVIHPFKSICKERCFVFNTICCLHMITFVLVVSILLGKYFFEETISSRLCLPFYDPLKPIITVVLQIFVCFMQCASCLGIALCHVLTISGLKKSQEKVKTLRTIPFVLNTIAPPLIVLSLSNVLCWIPTAAIYISVIILPQYSNELPIWMLVAAVPLNSLLYPTVTVAPDVKKCFTQTRQ